MAYPHASPLPHERKILRWHCIAHDKKLEQRKLESVSSLFSAFVELRIAIAMPGYNSTISLLMLMMGYALVLFMVQDRLFGVEDRVHEMLERGEN